MERTLRNVSGFRTRPDGATVIIGLETVEGVAVEIELLPEMVMDLILALLAGRTEAWVRSEGGVEAPVPSEKDRIRGVIPATKLISAYYPDAKKRLVQVVTDGGAIFEFLLPATHPNRLD